MIKNIAYSDRQIGCDQKYTEIGLELPKLKIKLPTENFPKILNLHIGMKCIVTHH